MNQEKIGRLIAQCRRDKKITQVELANKLGVTDKSVSKWENGKCLPDVSLYKELCNVLGITLNEFFAGEKIKEENFKEQADNNLFNALENSSFSLKEKIKYYGDKWDKEHFVELTIVTFAIAGFIIYGFIRNNGIQFIFMILGFVYGLFEKNRKQAYIERNAYKQIDNENDI